MRRKTAAGILAGFALVLASLPVNAGIGASSTISQQVLGPNSYEYDISVTNTGDTTIGTLWFGWIPGYDLLNNPPTSISAPVGWIGIDAFDYSGVASVQWVDQGSFAIQPGQTLTGFNFVSPDSNIIGGTSNYFGIPLDQSYVYIAAPEGDLGATFTPTEVAVPEPASLAFLIIPAALLIRRKRIESI